MNIQLKCERYKRPDDIEWMLLEKCVHNFERNSPEHYSKNNTIKMDQSDITGARLYPIYPI